MKKVVCWVVDHSVLHQSACLISINSFLRFNPVGWEMRVYSVGCGANFLAALPAGVVVESVGMGDRALLRTRVGLLSSGDLLLYLDADTVVLGSVDSVVERFLGSGCVVGMSELDVRSLGICLSGCWDWQWPGVLGDFSQRPVLSDGMMLCRGAGAVGEWALSNFSVLPGGGRGLIGSACYQLGVRVHVFRDFEHCVLREEALVHRGHPYLGPVYLNGNPVIVRHFLGWPTKGVLCNYIAYMTDHYVGRYVDCKE